jgi:chromosome segregation ATPase|tara:strand:- start:1194 stop:1616 length:423 start_codon:yes stop_codon:yes gene_type:complete
MSELSRELQRRQKNQEQFSALLEGYNDLMSAHQKQQATVIAQLREYTEEFESLSIAESEVRSELSSLKTEVAELSAVISELEQTHVSHTDQQLKIFSLMMEKNKAFEENVGKFKVVLVAALGVGLVWFITLGVMISVKVG